MLEIHSLQAFKSLASAYSTTAAYIKKKTLHRASAEFLEAPPGFEPGVKVLQTRALPLGYSAFSACPIGKKKKKTVRTFWSGKRDSNPRHSPWQGDALPLSYSRIRCPYCFLLVEVIGFEPMTLCL